MSRKTTDVDLLMRRHLEEFGLEYVPEYRFCIGRKWRFDWAVLGIRRKGTIRGQAVRMAIEINGSVWTQGRHTRGAGYIKDMEKRNFANLLGWTLFEFTPDQIRRGDDIPVIREWLDNRK
jgi:hypothetical protein